ncbi:MAG: amidohydrolase [Chloroflexota bacterium]|nr:amidohydrolase [Chloroflexota bacterium]
MSDRSADLILHNARVITLVEALPFAEMVAIKNGKIHALGDAYEVDIFRGAETKLIDCEGGAIIPGFNDAHCHPLGFATTLLYIDCSSPEVRSISDIQRNIHGHARLVAGGRWIRAAQYNETQLSEKRHPTCWELDMAAPNHPVILIHASGNYCVLNSMALRMVGITKETPDPPGGHIGHDEVTGEVNGFISGRNPYVENGVPPVDQEELRHGMSLATRTYLSQGITSVQDTTWSNTMSHWDFYRSLKETNIFIPRITMMVGINSLEEFRANGMVTGTGDSHLRLGGVKIALDESTGCAHPPQDELNMHALRAHRAGFQLALHIGDVQALQSALEALQHITKNDPNPIYRPRLEHCAICPIDLVPKIQSFGAMVVTQPSFLYYLGKSFRKDIPAQQQMWLYPLRLFKTHRVITAASSDSPLFSCNPLVSLYAAVTRRDKWGHPIAPGEALDVLDALRMYTQWAAYASSEEEIKGVIGRDSLADLVVLDGDPTRVEPGGLKDLKVVRTIIGGEVVWEG